MIKYNIIRDIKAEQMVEDCVRFLEQKNISSLPDNLVIGELKNIFSDDTTIISLKCTGENEGQFVLRQQKGNFLTLLHSAKFSY